LLFAPIRNGTRTMPAPRLATWLTDMLIATTVFWTLL
jgi:hypothetical protein